MEEDKKPERPTSAHSSDKEGVSESSPCGSGSTSLSTHTNAYTLWQDSFEDASEITPRPESHTERSQSRSRSLLGKRESTETTVQSPKVDAPAPEVPAKPTQANDEAEQIKGDVEAPETSTEDGATAKSPLLTSHRISVTSDMDDVSLDEGW